MTKKLFTLLLAVAASVGTMFASTQIGNLYYILDAATQTAKVAENSSASGEIIIPGSVTYNSVSYSVTSIGGSAFFWCSGLTSVTIPNSVTSIGGNAFFGCSGLTSIEIPNSVTSIGDGAFSECSSLTSLVYNAHVFAFMPTSYSGAYTIPDGIESIAGSAFSGCTGLTSVTIPNSVTSIGAWAFYYCTGLTSVTIPNSVTSIGQQAFDGCSALTSINVASENSNYCSVDGVLFNKDKTTLIQYPGGKQGAYTIPNSVTSIGNRAFYNCTGLTSVTIPNSVTGIGNYAFWDCTGLTSVTIPNSVTSLGRGAFQGCRGLTSVTIPNSVTSIGDYAFNGCSGLTSVTIPNSVTSIGDYAFNGCSGLTSVTIPNSVTSIGAWAFYNCSSLTSIEIPNSVTSIGARAFYECSGLTSITCEAVTPPTLGSNVFSSVNTSIPLYVPAESVEAYQTADVWKNFTNILPIEETPGTCITASGTCGAQGDNLTWELSCDSILTISGTGEMEDYAELVSIPWYSNRESIKSAIIEDGVTSIGDYAFYNCVNLTSIEIPNSVTSIGIGVFHGCGGLTSITLPNGVTSIGDAAFHSCSGLSSMTIPNGVTSIGEWTFIYCNGLTSIEIPNSVTSIGDYAFAACSSLSSVINYAITPQTINTNVFVGTEISNCTLYVPAQSIALYQAADVWKDFGNILPIDGSDNPEQEIGCIDYLNLNNAVCYVNNSSPNNTLTFNDFRQVPAVDNGPASMNSRHTVHFDRTETEPRTGGLAKTVPDGEFASVRLGNWDSNAEAERIEYTFEVDTARPILLVKYMPLLEAPAHGDYENPRFKIDVLINGQSLGSCSMIDINADDVMNGSVLKPEAIAQGWHITPAKVAQTSGDIVWKEWTTIGIDLSNPMYRGQQLTVRLTTHDCTFSAHCGYAYFTLGCAEKKLISTEDSVFMAPKEFVYRWMAASSEAYRRADGSLPEEYILSRSRDFHAETGGLYVVDCMSVQDSTCYFSLDASLPDSPEVIDPDTPSPEERAGQSTEGKEFWVTFLQADQDPNNDLKLSLSMSSREDCQVMISNPYTGYSEVVNVVANRLQLVELYNGNVLLSNARSAMAASGKVCYAGYSEQADTCALHVTATKNISLFATNYKRATFDATNVLPTGILGDEYIVQTYTPSDHGGVSQSQGSHFAIIATEDNTIVDYCPTVATLSHNQVGDTLHTPVLMAGQVFYVWTGKKDGETGDLSGTYVKARNGKRIAVFQGNPHTNVPYQVKQRDQLYSQAMPVQSWGSTFALTASAERPSDIIRVMALYDGTEVRINGETVHTFDFTVDTKHFWEFEIGPSGTYAQDGSCMLTTSQPVAVHLFLTSQQYKGDKNSNGDPAMLWVSPIEQQMEQVNFVTYNSINGTYSNYLNVVTDQPSGMTLDNTSITSHFSPVSGSNTYYYAQIALGSDATAHTLKCNGGRFNAHVYGFTSNESYGYSVGGFIEDLTLQIYINREPVSPDNDMCVRDTFVMDITTSFDYQSMKLDFGDGTVVYATDEEGLHARHAYDAPGVYHANVVVASNNNRLDSIPIRIIAGPLSLTYEPLNDIYVGDSIFYIYYHSPIQEMQIEKDFTIGRSFNDAALQDGFGHYTTRLNRSFYGVRIPEGARVGVEYAFNVEIHTLCEDYTATIPFVLKARRTGSCGDNLALTWTYDPETKTLTITGNGALNSNYTFGLEAPLEMEQLIIADGVTSIGANAFSNMSTLQTMQLPASLKTIGAKAFENDINLTAIYNYRERPCLVDATAFDGVNKFDCTLYVLEGSVDMYKSNGSDWKDFYYILPISTTEVTEPISEVTVEPSVNTATLTWPTSNNAASYTIQITKDGVLFCTLIFNGNGQLTGIAFAPGRNGQAHAPAAIMTANGLQFTVTGLNSNTQYGYSVVTKDASDQPIASYSGEFTTTGEIATGIDNIQGNEVQSKKFVRDGHILILRGDKTYTLQGQEVK